MSAVAQPLVAAGPGNEPAASSREQRRVEIRTALQPNRVADPASAKREASPPQGRHMTESQRAELREQLRQQTADTGRGRP